MQKRLVVLQPQGHPVRPTPGAVPQQGAEHDPERPLTRHVEFHLQHDLVGERRVAQELIGLLHGPVFCGDAIDGQDAVPHLQQPTPEPQVAQQREESA